MGSELERRRDLLPAPQRAATGVAVALVTGGIVAVVASAGAGIVVGAIAGGLAYLGLTAARGQLGAGSGGSGSASGASGIRPSSRPLSAADEHRAMHGDVRKLAPGDVVNYELVDWIVERTMTFDADGFAWHEHLLLDSDSGRKLWLSVEDDDGLEVAVSERVTGAEHTADERTIDHDGVSYARKERGTATFTTRDESGQVDAGQMEYADYAAGRRVLALERYGTSQGWEVSVGSVISEHELDIYAKSAG